MRKKRYKENINEESITSILLLVIESETPSQSTSGGGVVASGVSE